ncbi:hypothetical protein Tco_0507449 [Tanacetum coccineum]
MGNEPIMALPKGTDNFVVYYDARSKDLEACLEKGEGDCLLWVVEGLTWRVVVRWNRKDKLERVMIIREVFVKLFVGFFWEVSVRGSASTILNLIGGLNKDLHFCGFRLEGRVTLLHPKSN